MLDKLIHRHLRVPYRLHVSMMRRPRRARTTVLFLHGIGASGKSWEKVVNMISDDVKILSVDLIGFGGSPKPRWARYDARLQARSVALTLSNARVRGRVVVVGHSMGSLVAIELARMYPRLVQSIILCSPPLYDVTRTARRLLPSREKALLSIYKTIKSRPKQFVAVSTLAIRYGVVSDAISVTDANVEMYMNSLESAILNQTALSDVKNLTLPTHVLYGSLDPIVVARNVRSIQKVRENVYIKRVVAGHEIRGAMISATVNAIDRQVNAVASPRQKRYNKAT